MNEPQLTECDEESCNDFLCLGGFHVTEDNMEINEDVSIEGSDFSGDTRAILGHIGNHYFQFSDWFGWEYAGEFESYDDAVKTFEEFAHLPEGWDGEGTITPTVIDQWDDDIVEGDGDE